jgi:hypothetical protein
MYAYGRSEAVRKGVILTISGASDGETVTDATLHLTGTAQNATLLSLNDRAIVADLHGSWNEQFVLLPGYNVLSFKATDRFNKKTEQTLRVFYLAPAQTALSSEADPSPPHGSAPIIN